jgi:S-adenosylmethionine-dependent methyltransferase
MRDASAPFDTAPTEWQQWQDSPWGRLRFTLAEANLARHLDGGPVRVLDLAGGDGGDAVRLAARGHHVTIVDRASAMLTAATERAAAAGVAERIACVQADVAQLPSEIVQGGFDVVLCHNLLQYVDDVAATLGAASATLRPGGLLSVMAINRHSAPLVTAVRGMNLSGALTALDTDQARTDTFDTTITLHTAEEVRAVLDDLGYPDLAHYGIRSVCDYIADDERKHDPAFFAELERLELAVADRPPYVHIARLFQLVGRKPTAQPA